ncbi:MAG: universal stress protein [Anaerolineae bacterium]|nr:universal stress protein [Anaerolineae bacterium]
MFKKVLVPLDGSELAEAVLPYVEDLGKRCAAEVILLQVIATPPDRATAIYRPPKGDMPMAPLPESAEDVVIAQHPIYREQEMASLRAEAERSLAGAKERLSKAGLKVRVEVLFGRPADRIVEYAMKEEVDLIAMATHGRSGFSRWVFGSVAEKVLRATALPILLIRPPGADRYIQLPGVELKL